MADNITTVTLEDNKSAVRVDGQPDSPIYLRVRTVYKERLKNGDHYDLAVKVLAYRVDANGVQQSKTVNSASVPDEGAVVGETMHGALFGTGAEPDVSAAIRRLADRAVTAYLTRRVAQGAVDEFPDELI